MSKFSLAKMLYPYLSFIHIVKTPGLSNITPVTLFKTSYFTNCSKFYLSHFYHT